MNAGNAAGAVQMRVVVGLTWLDEFGGCRPGCIVSGMLRVDSGRAWLWHMYVSSALLLARCLDSITIADRTGWVTVPVEKTSRSY